MTTQPSSGTTDASTSGLAPLLLIISGAVWGLWYFGMNWIGWGEPGTARYTRYELYNRIAPAVLLLLLTATQIARRFLARGLTRRGHFGCHLASAGLAVMAIGSALEFWAFSESAYAPGSLRGYGWSTYCVGLLLFYIGTAIFGFDLRRLKGYRTPAVLLMCWLPAAAVSVLAGSLIGVGLPALSLAVALCGGAYVLIGQRLRTSQGIVSLPRAGGDG